VLAQSHPAARAGFPRWQLHSPVPPPEAATAGGTDPRIAKLQRGIDAWADANPVFASGHMVNADEPDEIIHGMLDPIGVSAIGPLASLCPEWMDAVSAGPVADRAWLAALINFRVLVQCLLWKNPLPPGGALVLKCPFTAAHLGRFLEVFPQSRVCVIVRDPVRALESAFQVLDEAYRTSTEPSRYARARSEAYFASGATRQLGITAAAAALHVRMRDDPRLLFFTYASFMADPAAPCGRGARPRSSPSALPLCPTRSGAAPASPRCCSRSARAQGSAAR